MSPPIMAGRNRFEKLSKASRRRIILSPSPSQSLLFAECQYGLAKQAWALVNPMIRPTIPTDVCGARPTTSSPNNWLGLLFCSKAPFRSDAKASRRDTLPRIRRTCQLRRGSRYLESRVQEVDCQIRGAYRWHL